MKTVDYYKKVLKQAREARAAIREAEEKYQRDCSVEKEMLESGMLGQEGYDASIAKHGEGRDGAINEALSWIDSVADEYGALMDSLGRLDGSKIDNGTMALLNSGMKLSSADWQELADAYKDNYVMSRILRERYEADPPKDLPDAREDGAGAFIMSQAEKGGAQPVVFGQSPKERKAIFNSFAGLVRHTAKTGACLREFASQESYWNYLAKESIGKMQPFPDEGFDSVGEDFPVECQEAGSHVW